MLDGRLAGRVVHDGVCTWNVYAVVDGEDVDLLNGLLAEAEWTEEADRNGVTWLAFAMAAGDVPGGDR